MQEPFELHPCAKCGGLFGDDKLVARLLRTGGTGPWLCHPCSNYELLVERTERLEKARGLMEALLSVIGEPADSEAVKHVVEHARNFLYKRPV